jgi:hypothetical protein
MTPTLARRAAEHARTSGRVLVVVTVVPVTNARGLREDGQLLGGLDDYEDARAIAWRVGPTLDALAVAYQLEIRGYLARGGPRRQARRIAATVLRVARQTGAEVIAVGQPRDRAPSAVSVSARIAEGAPAHVLVSFVQPEPPRAAGRVSRGADTVPAADGDLAGIEGAGRPVGDPSGVILTHRGRRLLAERAHRLRAALDDRDGSGEAEYVRTVKELRRHPHLGGLAAGAGTARPPHRRRNRGPRARRDLSLPHPRRRAQPFRSAACHVSTPRRRTAVTRTVPTNAHPRVRGPPVTAEVD